jgi:F-type H+-transporting ATPase subunit gamma
MANLIDIRRRIKSTKNTAQITKAMKMGSASRLRRASERATNARPYAERLFEVHGQVLSRMTDLEGPLYQEKSAGKTLLVVLAGDKGLCGSFNANIFKRVQHYVNKRGGDAVDILPIGNKAVTYFKKLGITTLKGYAGVFRSFSVSLAEEIAERLIQAYQDEDQGFQRVILIFNTFKNVLIQEVTDWQVLPLPREEADQAVTAVAGPEHLAEPSLEVILQQLSPRVITTRVYQALLESCASEHAARMTAMDAATNNALEMIDNLTLEMNKARQAAITKELIEVVSGAAAL